MGWRFRRTVLIAATASALVFPSCSNPSKPFERAKRMVELDSRVWGPFPQVQPNAQSPIKKPPRKARPEAKTGTAAPAAEKKSVFEKIAENPAVPAVIAALLAFALYLNKLHRRMIDWSDPHRRNKPQC